MICFTFSFAGSNSTSVLTALCPATFNFPFLQLKDNLSQAERNSIKKMISALEQSLKQK